MARAPHIFGVRRPTIPAVDPVCARASCERPAFFRLELVLFDGEGRHTPLALPGFSACAECAASVQAAGAAPFLLLESVRKLAAWALADRGFGRLDPGRTELRLYPIVGESTRAVSLPLRH